MPNWWSKLGKRIAVLRQIHSVGELLLFGAMFLFALITPLLLRLPLPRLAALLDSPTRRQSASRRPPEAAKARQIAALMNGVIELGRPLVRPTCLTRGLTQYYFLRCAGFDIALYFGTGEMDKTFAAHCWLVRDGEPFLEKNDPRLHFSPIYSVPMEAMNA